MLSIGGNGSISQTTQYLDYWLSDLLRSEVKMLKVEGARASVRHSWRHHWATVTAMGVDHGGRGEQVPPEFGVGEGNANCPPRILSPYTKSVP